MAKLKSTVPGLIYPSGRDVFMQTGFGFLEGRRKDDGAEGLWRIYDNLYNLESFIRNHPGGSEWLIMTKGTDITEAFETHHLTTKAEQLLPKFFVRKAASPRKMPYTFLPDGFYRKFKERASKALKNVDYHAPAKISKFITDSFLIITLLTAIAAAITNSWIFVIMSGVFLTWTTIASHNFFHMRDNFRMYYFDLCFMSSKEWRISHALSHHLYPNTLWDMEVYTKEPLVQYLPHSKSVLYRLVSPFISYAVFFTTFFVHAVKRYYSIFVEWKNPEFRDAIPFFLPLLMSFYASSPFTAIKLWLLIIIASSFVFSFIGFNAAHHHPQIFHDGDVCRKDLDWGLMELDATRDRKVIDDSLFLVLTNFGSHVLHHLLPTVDHHYLGLCLPAFRETCREFGIENEKMSSWELIKGQCKQVVRNEPKSNYRGGPDGVVPRSL